MTDQQKLKQIIIDFEDNKLNINDAIKAINTISNEKITQHELLTYWNNCSLDSFILKLTEKQIDEWEEINDVTAIKMITEIIDNVDNDTIVDVNSSALEKRYRKPSGTISNLVFIDGIENPSTILYKLKKSDVITL